MTNRSAYVKIVILVILFIPITLLLYTHIERLKIPMSRTKKHIFGIVTVGEKGQIVIPKKARAIFNINPGDSLLVLGDESKGIAIVKTDILSDIAETVLKTDE